MIVVYAVLLLIYRTESSAVQNEYTVYFSGASRTATAFTLPAVFLLPLRPLCTTHPHRELTVAQ